MATMAEMARDYRAEVERVHNLLKAIKKELAETPPGTERRIQLDNYRRILYGVYRDLLENANSIERYCDMPCDTRRKTETPGKTSRPGRRRRTLFECEEIGA